MHVLEYIKYSYAWMNYKNVLTVLKRKEVKKVCYFKASGCRKYS